MTAMKVLLNVIPTKANATTQVFFIHRLRRFHRLKQAGITGFKICVHLRNLRIDRFYAFF